MNIPEDSVVLCIHTELSRQELDHFEKQCKHNSKRAFEGAPRKAVIFENLTACVLPELIRLWLKMHNVQAHWVQRDFQNPNDLFVSFLFPDSSIFCKRGGTPYWTKEYAKEPVSLLKRTQIETFMASWSVKNLLIFPQTQHDWALVKKRERTQNTSTPGNLQTDF